jgi:acyl dehydratase
MAVSSKHILAQGPVIKGLGKTAFAAIQQHFQGTGGPATVPGPAIHRTIPPRPKDLVRAYVRHVGGDPSEYKKVLPPHLFPQWGFGLAAETLMGIPYPLMKVMNGGCRLEVNGPLPADQPLEVCAQLVGVDDNGRRAVLHQRITTGTQQDPELVVGHLYAIVPLGGGKPGGGTKGGKPGKKKEKPRVPDTAREVGFWKLRQDAGLDFAKLTGDFNPIHWIAAYAKASGFRNTILHGFGTFARAYEGLHRGLWKGTQDIKMLDVQFTRPLVLPAKVGLYIDDVDHAAGTGQVFVGDAVNGPAYMTGSYTIAGPQEQS